MTRLLTKEEIEGILDFIEPNPHIPRATAISVVDLHKDSFRRQLSSQKVYPETLKELKEQIKKYYYDSMITPGESVGVVCAQSIGERQTQQTLNTFHSCGQSHKGVTAGVPRFQEILNATKDPKNKSCKIYFTSANTGVQDLRDRIGCSLVELTLGRISKKMTIHLNKTPDPWYSAWTCLYEDCDWFRSLDDFKHCISIEVDRGTLFEYKLSLEEISLKINETWDDLYCVFSTLDEGLIHVYVDTSSIELPTDRLLFIDSSNKELIYLEECVQRSLSTMVVAGIRDVENIYYTKTDEGEWFIETDGSNFREILCHPDVDTTRTISNNVWDIYEILGVEAAREFLLQECLSIMEGINKCHTRLLVDRMTFSGTISSISRYTMRNDESGPMSRASFEETTDNFLKAASRGEIESTHGVSASIMCGKRAKIGTGMMDLKININALMS
jgi:DNA-directed RNA polymerase beta' subunit